MIERITSASDDAYHIGDTLIFLPEYALENVAMDDKLQSESAKILETLRRITMNNTDRTVLVTGATGRQGGSVIRHMLAKGWKLRALTRKPDSAASRELAGGGIEVVAGNMEEANTLGPALRGAYGVFSVQDFWAVGATREVQQGKNLADAAK